MLINGLAIVVYALTCVYIIRRDKRFTVFFAFLTFSQLWALISCFYNDLGIYNIELFRYTESTYATFRLGALYVVFNLGFLLMMAAVKDRPLARVEYRWSRETLNLGGLKLAVYGAIALIILNIAYSFATGGIPAFSGFGKLSYFETTSGVERLLIMYGFLVSFLLGYFRPPGKRLSLQSVLMGLYVVYLMLTGNKFSALISTLTYYYAPIFARFVRDNPAVKIFTTRTIVITAVIVLVLVGIAFGSYFWVLGDSSLASTYLTNRILAFQGEMWWAVDFAYHNEGLYDPGHWKTELDAIVSPGDVSSTQIGMKYLMVRVLGPEKAYPIIEKGYLFTMTYPGILIAMFPLWTAFIVQFFAGTVFFMILYYLYYSIIYRHVVRAMITVTVLLPYMVVLATGNFFVFFSLGMVMKISILLLLEIVGNRQGAGDNGIE